MRPPRPIVIVDTSVLIADGLSRTRGGAASKVVAIVPAVVHLVLCMQIREELVRKLVGRAGWPEAAIDERYGPLFEAALWVEPVQETEQHRRFVNGDENDTMIPRTAEAIYLDPRTSGLVTADQLRAIVAFDRRHLRPGSDWAGFRIQTPDAFLRALSA